jgi:hypothetical protein
VDLTLFSYPHNNLITPGHWHVIGTSYRMVVAGIAVVVSGSSLPRRQLVWARASRFWCSLVAAADVVSSARGKWPAENSISISHKGSCLLLVVAWAFEGLPDVNPRTLNGSSPTRARDTEMES